MSRHWLSLTSPSECAVRGDGTGYIPPHLHFQTSRLIFSELAHVHNRNLPQHRRRRSFLALSLIFCFWLTIPKRSVVGPLQWKH